MRYVYPCDLEPEEEEGFEGVLNVSFPDVPGALTCGQGRKEALEMAEDALTIILGVYVERNQELPIPSPVGKGQELVAVPPLAAAKLALYTAMRQQSITQDFLAEKLGLTGATVRRLLEPDRHSPWSQVTRALALVGRKLVVEDRAA
jgi:antitoxin HicB